jgi:hypothetical protein
LRRVPVARVFFAAARFAGFFVVFFRAAARFFAGSVVSGPAVWGVVELMSEAGIVSDTAGADPSGFADAGFVVAAGCAAGAGLAADFRKTDAQIAARTSPGVLHLRKLLRKNPRDGRFVPRALNASTSDENDRSRASPRMRRSASNSESIVTVAAVYRRNVSINSVSTSASVI